MAARPGLLLEPVRQADWTALLQFADLFLSRAELTAEALKRHEDKVAYVDEKLAAEAGESG